MSENAWPAIGRQARCRRVTRRPWLRLSTSWPPPRSRLWRTWGGVTRSTTWPGRLCSRAVTERMLSCWRKVGTVSISPLATGVWGGSRTTTSPRMGSGTSWWRSRTNRRTQWSRPLRRWTSTLCRSAPTWWACGPGTTATGWVGSLQISSSSLVKKTKLDGCRATTQARLHRTIGQLTFGC